MNGSSIYAAHYLRVAIGETLLSRPLQGSAECGSTAPSGQQPLEKSCTCVFVDVDSMKYKIFDAMKTYIVLDIIQIVLALPWIRQEYGVQIMIFRIGVVK